MRPTTSDIANGLLLECCLAMTRSPCMAVNRFILPSIAFALPPAQRKDSSVAVTVGVLVLRSVIGQRRVRHADDRKGHATRALRNGLGHRALTAAAGRAGTRPAITPRPAHRGVADRTTVAILDRNRHHGGPR